MQNSILKFTVQYAIIFAPPEGTGTYCGNYPSLPHLLREARRAVKGRAAEAMAAPAAPHAGQLRAQLRRHLGKEHSIETDPNLN